MGMYCAAMPRAATTSDAFNAVAEPRRREILSFLAVGERPVNDLVSSLKLAQPSVSKHLRVLRDVGLVNVRRDGRRMLYRTNSEAIRPLHEWTETFERFWQQKLERIKERAEAKERAETRERAEANEKLKQGPETEN
jgi:DNA-binding transcriptional ArsR family regulator